MILVDTSAWVEFLRATGSPVHRYLRRAIERQEQLATTEIVVLELLAGARDERHLKRLRGLLLRFDLLALRSIADYEAAATLYRTCRRSGVTIRSLTDCLVAVPAIRASAAILHADRDFDAIARHSALRVIDPAAS